jgi:fatty acid desaturase
VIFYFPAVLVPGPLLQLSQWLLSALWSESDKPIAWGVSSYGKIYNWLFFYNGYHAEHHFRPKVHWTKMEQFHQSIEEPAKAGKAFAQSSARICSAFWTLICRNVANPTPRVQRRLCQTPNPNCQTDLTAGSAPTTTL